jgi:CheY-like chemotaxis protein
VPARNPTSAVLEARTLRPAAILLDMLMPVRDGRDILQELKSDPTTSSIPVVVLTVVDAADVPELADAHVSKPIRLEPLLRVLAELGAEPQGAEPPADA